jgi:thiol-disulfide isomerase/thioredoxin
MKKALLITLLNIICTFAFSQKKLKRVQLLENSTSIVTDDSYCIRRLSIDSFKSLVKNSPKLLIQFWQPWCGGAYYAVSNAKSFREKISKYNVPYIMISDSRFEKEYLEIDSTQAGSIVLYLNKFTIDFPTFMIESNKQLDDYRKIIYASTNHEPVKHNMTFYIENGNILYYEDSYFFYKKKSKKVLDHLKRKIE